MPDIEYSREGSLSPEDKAFIKDFIKKISELGRSTKAPLDPKIENCLDIAHALAVEQLQLDKKYEWMAPAVAEDKFFYEEDTPSSDELSKWLG